jgi:tetratricopeptide (TPR) repeat protein
LILLSYAYTPPRLYAQGDLHPRETADKFEAVLREDSLNAEANWRAAIALVDIGKQTPDNEKNRARDSLYRVAEGYARRAVRQAPQDASPHFALALALGKASMTMSARQRVKYAGEIKTEVERALEIDPNHDGAWHLMGRWHAEIERLSNIEEFFAKTLLGGKVFNEASWDEALRSMRKAVELRPDFIFHRLDLAEMLFEIKRGEEARPHLERVKELPEIDAMDDRYKLRASILLSQIREQN